MDVNKIVDIINEEWARDMADAKRRLAILSEEVIRLRAENEELRQESEATTKGGDK